MTQPYLGEIRPFACNFTPRGWAFCAGQLLPITQNTALFALLGTFYGGNGTSNFALPDLRGRTPLGMGQGAGLTNRVIGAAGGEENVTVTLAEMPVHNHGFFGTAAAADSPRPVNGSLYARSTGSDGNIGQSYYGSAQQMTSINPTTVSPYGGGQPHTNLQPYLVINWCIALQGIFPSRN